ncbi:hypothetical protein SAMN05216276_101285 [Streptosporangium subroseum]|uniref:Uncharacterized protein n=1 Tax=Streptosporangium subroseum TaxID=106412 RepID=A0A239FTX5_9ACTN|nr:hypothetical protein [Streptosporangium subroseum]SNS60279.1 hypothetical protein SAMN05216276_101285 [Streptosporangium subroseum]
MPTDDARADQETADRWDVFARATLGNDTWTLDFAPGVRRPSGMAESSPRGRAPARSHR